jgi:hypothetical protein
MKDFFVSYNGADEAWATWVAWELENAGYTVIIQAWDFHPGTNFVAEMQRAITKSRRTIAILSSNYLRSEFALSEWTAAFVQDPRGEQGTLLPVRVEEFNPPGLLSTIIYIDLVDKYEEDARRILLTSVRRVRAKPSSSPPFPGKTLAPKFPGPSASVERSSAEDPLPRGIRRWVQRLRKRRSPEVKPEAARRQLLEQVRRVCIDEMLNDMRQEVSDTFNIKVSVSKDTDDAATASLKTAPREEFETDIVTAFDEADHLLLILGEPGTGKTFKLLELLEELLGRAERGETWRIPVYLNLSSWVDWAGGKKPIRDWLVSEVMSFYGLRSRGAVERLVDGEELALLLDGLDEITAGRADPAPAADEDTRLVSEACRRRCLHEINNYIYSSNIWLALCCRKKEYDALDMRLYKRRDDSTATIKPLMDAELDDYLEKAGTELKALREAISQDALLREMSSMPFLLRMMSVAYRKKKNLSAKVIVEGGRGGKGARLKDLFEKYVDERRHTTKDPLPKEYEPMSMRGYLGQLADMMERGKSKLFHVDQLQPDGVGLSRLESWLYRLLVSLLLFLFLWVLVGLPAGWALGYEWASHEWVEQNGAANRHLEPLTETIRNYDLRKMLWVTLCCGGTVAVGFAIFRGLGFGVMCGMAIGLTRALVVKLGPGGRFPEWATHGLLTIVLGTVLLLLMLYERDHARDRISPLKRAKLHLYPALLGAGAAAVVGVLLGGVLSLILGPREGWPRGLAFGCALMPVCVLFYGYRTVSVEVKTRANQGIRNSTSTALWTTLWSALTGALCFGFFYSFIGPQAGVVNSILGLSLGATSLVYGGMPVMQHWSLRTVLYLRRLAPFRLARFLRAAESLQLLRRIGGGYAFRHEYLREYFLEYHKTQKGWKAGS